jgi:tRNA 2-selenouridine synthase
MVEILEFLSLRNQLPVIDVRSEGEYEEGHMRNAFSIPLLNNAERVAVGTDYKQKGQQEAIKTGFRLVGPRLAGIIEETEQIGRELLVYCWRGGMRSSNFCQFVGMARIKTQTLQGGYKAYRQVALESFKRPLRLMVIGGCTGSGKSEILRALEGMGEQVIDLENLANHKGSAFGGLMMPPQPTTEQFQNDLFEKLLNLDLSKRVWIEDESLAVGRIFLPHDLWTQMGISPVVEIEVKKEVRIERLVNEYGAADKNEFLEAMTKVNKKLGGQHFKRAKEMLLQGDMASTIDILLAYYDKAYTMALDKKKGRIKLQVPWDGKNVNNYVRDLVDEVNALPEKVYS